MDIEYGCNVSNRYNDFLNISESDVNRETNSATDNKQKKNKSKQRKKKNPKLSNRKQSDVVSETIFERDEVEVLNEAIGKCVEIVANSSQQIKIEVEAKAVESVAEKVQSNEPIVDVVVEPPADAVAETEVKWSEICIEEDKAIAEQNQNDTASLAPSSNENRKVYQTIVYYNSNFGNGNRFVRFDGEPRRRHEMRKFGWANHRYDAQEQQDKRNVKQSSESINDCNNINESVDGAIEANGKSGDQIMEEPKKRKRQRKWTKNRQVKRASAMANELNQSDAVKPIDRIALVTGMQPAIDVLPSPSNTGDDKKSPIRKRHRNKFQRVNRTNAMPNVEQQPTMTNGKPANEEKPHATIDIVCDRDQTSRQQNKIENRSNADAMKTTDLPNVNKSNRYRFNRRKPKAAAIQQQSID